MPRLALAAVPVLALFACKGEGELPPPDRIDDDPTLQRYGSCAELGGGLVDAYVEQLVSWRYGGGYAVLEDANSGASDGGGSAPTDHSSTNLQEQGVDEPDIVKTDGTTTYVIDPSWYGLNTLHIVKTWPVEDSEVLGTLAFEGVPYSMFLFEELLVVYSWADELPSGVTGRPASGTRISLVDVADPTRPTVTREIDIEGWLAAARRIDSDVYSVVTTWPTLPDALLELAWAPSLGLPDDGDFWELDEAGQEAARERARRVWRPRVQSVVDGIGAQNLLPRLWDHAPGEEVDPTPIARCDDVYHPQGITRPGTLTVAHLDLAADAGTEVSTTTLLSDGWQVYASRDALYVAQSSWWWWWGWGDLDQTTHVHKFDLAGPQTTYVASGAVQGWIRDAFSFSEHEGYLRVATGDFWWWGCWTADCDEDPEPPASNVFVLEQADTTLEVVGALRGIAPDEQIQAMRFLGDKGFMVTFERIDPLFTIDLSDPTAPRLVGELEMPGFSAYLHPIDDGDKLLAVGMEGDDEGRIFGVKLNVFDVSDFANPTIVDELVVDAGEYSWSEALWDHHAFTFHRDNLSLPFYSYSWRDSDSSYDAFSGVLSVDVDTEAGTVDEVGRVSHQDLVEDSICLWDAYGPEAWYGGEDVSYCDMDGYWYASVRRSVVIEDHLLSISDYGIKVTDLADPGVVEARVLFYPR